MSSLAFVLILFSGLMHALYNLLIKRSRNKTVFIWWMFASSTTLFTLALPFLPGPFPRPDFIVIFLGAGESFFFILYHLITGRAYRSGNRSTAALARRYRYGKDQDVRMTGGMVNSLPRIFMGRSLA